MPIPLTVNDLRMLVRGRVPGDLARYTRAEPRTDGTVLFMARDSATSEYVLVDTVRNVLRQYQRRKAGVGAVLTIVMGDVRPVAGINIPHAVDIDIAEQESSASFRFTRVTVNEPVTAKLEVAIPTSFTRTTFR
jgi:hypothetical protein